MSELKAAETLKLEVQKFLPTVRKTKERTFNSD